MKKAIGGGLKEAPRGGFGGGGVSEYIKTKSAIISFWKL